MKSIFAFNDLLDQKIVRLRGSSLNVKITLHAHSCQLRFKIGIAYIANILFSIWNKIC